MARSLAVYGLAALPIPLDLAPMEARSAATLPDGPGWQYEPKWDGFRCLVFRAGDEVELIAKSGKSLARFFPEMLDVIRTLPAKSFVLDGELLIPQDGSYSFDALQARLHPALSRITRLAHETPAHLVAFDLLTDYKVTSILDKPLTIRRQVLEAFMMNSHSGSITLTDYTLDRDVAQSWLMRAGGAQDGVVAKHRDLPYRPGERAMIKVKRIRTADCVVGGFRYLSKANVVGSLLLGLYNSAGKLDHVGFTSALHDQDRAALTRRLEAMVAPPGFTGNAPGGPSRWATERSTAWFPVKPVLVVEVAFDHVTGGRFRHGARLLRWRPDKRPDQCTLEQLDA
jgi:ATP-dependent DNA ligase